MESPRCIANGPKYNEICCTGFLNCTIKNLNCAVFRVFNCISNGIVMMTFLEFYFFVEINYNCSQNRKIQPMNLMPDLNFFLKNCKALLLFFQKCLIV